MSNMVKKHFKLFIFLLLILVPVSASVGAPRIFVNGYFVDSDADPVIENGRTLVPVRIISEKLGYKVDWDAANKTVEIKGDAKTIKLTIGSSTYLDDGTEKPLDVGAKIVNSRTMVPIRLVSEAFSQNVVWDNVNRVVAVGTGYQDQASSTCTFEAAKVTRVIDGDTIEIDRGKGVEKLRFILVDSPETKDPRKQVEYYGKEASKFTTKWLEGRTIYLEKDVSETDKYGRLLRYVWLVKPGTDNPTEEEITSFMFNSYLLRDGYAVVAKFPPDIKYVEIFKTFETYAREKNLGLYGVPINVGKETTEAPKENSPAETVTEENKKEEENKNTPKNTTKNNSKELAYKYANGRIIGNKKRHIYHVPTGRDYKKVHLKNAVFFDTEEEAIKAGYRRAKQ